LRLGNKIVFLWMLFGVFLIISQQQKAIGTTVISVNASIQPPNNYTIVVFTFVYTNLNDDGLGLYLTSPLASITNGEDGVPFQTIVVSDSMKIYSFGISPPVDALSGNFTLTWVNFTTNIVIGFNPIFLVEPQSQSVLIGSNATFIAQAIHTSGYQWQKDGTNLVENSHFAGVTNSMLTISNAQSEDAGDYIVIANHPTNPTPTTGARLSVFKPIQIGLTKSPSDGSYQLQVGNQDSRPVDGNEATHFTIYTTTNLNLGLSDWDVEAVTGILTNGIYQTAFPDDGSPSRFWQVGQQP